MWTHIQSRVEAAIVCAGTLRTLVIVIHLDDKTMDARTSVWSQKQHGCKMTGFAQNGAAYPDAPRPPSAGPFACLWTWRTRCGRAAVEHKVVGDLRAPAFDH